MTFIEGTLGAETIDVNGHTIPTTGYEFSQTPVAGTSAWIGIRPEHVTTGEAALASHFSTEVTVEIVEPMGSDTIVDCTVSGAYFRFRMDGQARVKPGDLVSIGFDPKQASLFDPASELRL